MLHCLHGEQKKQFKDVLKATLGNKCNILPKLFDPLILDTMKAGKDIQDAMENPEPFIGSTPKPNINCQRNALPPKLNLCL